MSQITVNVLSHKSIEKAIAKTEQKKKDLQAQCKEFCNRLADVGIRAAVDATSGDGLAKYVVFSKKMVYEGPNGCEMIMFGLNTAKVFGDGIDAAEISPILMLEFGSGKYAVPFQIWDPEVPPVGRGTFPGQKWAWLDSGWYYKTADGEVHHSFGTKPSYPIQKAHDQMYAQVRRIAKEVFKI